MERQAVVIFLQDQLPAVEDFRKHWDPLRDSIPAHITLVYPVTQPRYEQALARELGALLEEFPRFALSLSEVRVWEQEYLFLVAGRGGEQITRLHYAMYNGPFRHAQRPALFVPHMTIGRSQDPARLAAAAAEADRLGIRADALASTVSVYRISDDGQRGRTLDVPLRSHG